MIGAMLTPITISLRIAMAGCTPQHFRNANK